MWRTGLSDGWGLLDHLNVIQLAFTEQEVSDEFRGLALRVELEDDGVRRFIEGVAGLEELLGLAFDLKDNLARDDGADDGTRLNMGSGFVVWSDVDLPDLHPVDSLLAIEGNYQQLPPGDFR